MADKKAAQPQIHWIIWGALTFSVVIYAVVGTIVAGNPNPAPELQLMLPIFTVLSLSITGMVLFGSRLIANATKVYFTYAILRWALSESVAIFGLVMKFLGADALVLYVFVGWSLLLYLVLAPRQSEIERFEQFLKQPPGPARRQ